jgi:hypothetical protein
MSIHHHSIRHRLRRPALCRIRYELAATSSLSEPSLTATKSAGIGPSRGRWHIQFSSHGR